MVFRVNRNALASGAYDTYALKQRPAAKNRRASCDEVDCPNYLHGWRTSIDPKSDQGPAQLLYLRGDRTRKATETADPVSGLVTFTYEAGQTCFGEHWIEMQQLYLVGRGDHRTPDRQKGYRRHTRAEFWVEEFGENQDRLADRAAKG
jgi:hypothetical protein